MPVDDNEKVKVTINGEEREVTVAEVRKGYMLNADYTQKTQSLAEQRRQLDEQLGEVETLRATVQEWEDWYSNDFLVKHKTQKDGKETTMPDDKKPDQTTQPAPTPSTQPDISKLMESMNALNNKIEMLQGTISKKDADYAALQDRLSATESNLNNFFQFTSDLKTVRADFEKKYPGVPFNEDAVVDYIDKSPKSDITKADWELAAFNTHQDAIVNKRASEHQPAPPATPPSSPSTIFKAGSSEGRPKNFDEAADKSMSLLREQ